MSTKPLPPELDPNMVWDILNNTWIPREEWNHIKSQLRPARTAHTVRPLGNRTQPTS